MKFLNQEYYKQLEQLRAIIRFTLTIKESFLSEEMFNVTLNTLKEEEKNLKAKIKANL